MPHLQPAAGHLLVLICIMTNSASPSEASGIQKPPQFVQIPKELIRYARTLKLTGTQYDLWLYLWELDPYGDRWVDIPPPVEIAALLSVDPRTVQRAARRLEDCDLFDFQIERWKCRNTTVSVKTRNHSTGKEIRLPTKRSKGRQNDPVATNQIPLPSAGSNDPNEGLRPLQEEDSESPHTLHTDPHSLINKRETVERTGENSQFLLSEEFLPAFREWLLNRAKQLPQYPALIEQWVEIQAKVEANQKDFLNHLESKNGVNVPPRVPDRFQIEMACTQAVLNGDRAWALGKLQRLWAEGWTDLVQDLCQLYQEWGFFFTSSGVEDGQDQNMRSSSNKGEVS